MTAKVELSLSGPLDHLRVAWQTGEALLETVPFEGEADQTRYNALLAIQEMLTNVLRHAHGGRVDLPVRLSYEASDDGFSVEIRDRGAPFDPRDHLFEQPMDGSMPTEPGGYGILIARMVMDELDHWREDGWNVLRMHKGTAEVAADAAVEVARESVEEPGR